MTAKTVTRQAVRQRAAALGAGKTPQAVEPDMNDAVADANVRALDAKYAEMARPAAREAVREEVLPPGAVRGRNGEILMRKRPGTGNKFEVPEYLKDPYYSYEWKMISILNQEDKSYQNTSFQNGWRPVLAVEQWSGVFTPTDWVGSIDIDGLRLCERPKVLTEQAYDEERQKAKSLMRGAHESLRLATPGGFTTNHAGVQPKTSQTYELGPAPSKRTLVSD